MDVILDEAMGYSFDCHAGSGEIGSRVSVKFSPNGPAGFHLRTSQHKAPDIRQAVTIGERRKPFVPDDFIYLTLCFLLHFWIAHHSQEERAHYRHDLGDTVRISK